MLTNPVHRTPGRFGQGRIQTHQRLVLLLGHRILVEQKRTDPNPMWRLVGFLCIVAAHLKLTAGQCHGGRVMGGHLRGGIWGDLVLEGISQPHSPMRPNAPAAATNVARESQPATPSKRTTHDAFAAVKTADADPPQDDE